MPYYVYLLSNTTNTTLYTGVTSNLLRRVYEHKNNLDPKSFTSRYHVHKLVFFEQTTDVRAAIERESRSKAGAGNAKISLSMQTIHDGKTCTIHYFPEIATGLRPSQ